MSVRVDTSTVVKVLLAAGVIGYLVYVIEPERLLAAAAAARPGWIAAAVLLLPLNVALEGGVWFFLVRKVVPEVPVRSSYAALLCGYALGLFTPGRVGELAGRAFYLQYPDKWELGTVVFTQRMIDMVMAVNLGLLALLFFIQQQSPEPALAWWGVAAFGAGTGLTLTLGALFPKITYRLLRRVLPQRAHRRAAFLQRLAPVDRARILGLALLRFGVYATQFYLLLRAFTPVGLLTGYVGVGLVFYAKFLIPPVTFLDLGIREGAAVFFFGQLGVIEAAAFNASFLLFMVNLVLPALLGVPFVLRLRLKRGASDERASAEPPSPSLQPDAEVTSP